MVAVDLLSHASIQSDAQDNVIKDAFVNSIGACLGSMACTVGIGVADDRDILGLQSDLNFKNQDIDAWQNWLMTMMINTIGGGVVCSLVKSRIEAAGSEVVCLVHVKPASKPVYAKTTKGEKCFYVRSGNTTRMLDGPEIVDYVKERWG